MSIMSVVLPQHYLEYSQYSEIVFCFSVHNTYLKYGFSLSVRS